jgi:glutamyl-tRNA synthetase
MVRVRFAPSPTGYLHVGGARTALFNWLYARRHGGTFVLRIEDTDAERSSWEMVTGIVDGLRWLGLDWDEGPDIGGPHAPYFQSERIAQYREAAERLVKDGRAYYCYCSPEQLQQKRQAGEAAAGGWVYDRTCLTLAPEDVARREGEGAPRAVRFRVPDGETAFTDLVRGDIRFDNAHIEDFVILRSDRQPTYHLSVVVDDVAMEITHVVRGDDHISNTPKQVLLYEAFGRPAPSFAHVPLIMGPDKKRLSKRHGATSVMEYARLGYLPEAMGNFLALLGWSPGSDEEVFTRDELVSRFTLEGISGGNAVFNHEKLEWFNQQHLARLPAPELAARVRPLLEAAGLWSEVLAGARGPWFTQLLALLQPRAKKLEQIVDEARPFLEDTLARDEAAAAKHLSNPSLKAPMEALAAQLATLEPYEATAIEGAVRETAESRGIKAGTLIHATRVAVTGRAVSPGIFETLELLGRERAAERLRLAAAALPLA